ncbi:MAG: hypothetical protein Q9163_004264 [Psora crenata]
MSLSKALKKGKAFLTPRGSSESILQYPDSFTRAHEGQLFPKVDATVDGADCDQDCETCEIQLPKGFKVDEDKKLYGHVNGWATHMLVATGKTDWVRDIGKEKGSVMEAVRECKVEPSNGKLMLSASNMPLPPNHGSQPTSDRPTTVLLLPSFTFIDQVTPATVQDLIIHHISSSHTNTTPHNPTASGQSDAPASNGDVSDTVSPDDIPSPPSSPFPTRPCPHKYLILLCSHRTRDARCGQSAPLLRREFERHLRPLGLHRDLDDERPGGVGIFLISHVGGHKFAANVMVYRRADSDVEGRGLLGEANQCIWLARVRPEDCEGIIKFTVLQGKVVKPERQLRGGFDRSKRLVSW